METPKLYGDLADWWPLLSAPADYAEEAAFYQRAAARRVRADAADAPGARKRRRQQRVAPESAVRRALVDPIAGMLEHSRRLNPECEHVAGRHARR